MLEIMIGNYDHEKFEFALTDYTLPSFPIHTFPSTDKVKSMEFTRIYLPFTLITDTYSVSDNIKLIITIYISGSAWMCRMHSC